MAWLLLVVYFACCIVLGMVTPSYKTRRYWLIIFCFVLGTISAVAYTNNRWEARPTATPIVIIVTATPEGSKQ